MKRGSSDLPERIGERWQIDGKGYLDFDIKKKKKSKTSRSPPRIALDSLPETEYSR